MADELFLSEGGLRPLLDSIDCSRKVANARIESDSERIAGTRLWLPLNEATHEQVSAGLRSARPVNSFKGVLLPVREMVARYGKTESGDPLQELSGQSVALIGMRGCECRALGYLDKVMLGEPTADPFYQERRSRCVVISVDCVLAAESCFCNLYGEKAYPESGFDVNLSPVQTGYVVTAGSEAGKKILEQNMQLLAPATAGQLKARRAMQEKTADQLAARNAEYSQAGELAQNLPQTLDEVFWCTELAECVQCGGCTAVCPTCYCFLLCDRQEEPGSYARSRVWDSCQFTGYSQMAGPPGTRKPDPRRDHMSKFQRRFAHKLWHDVKVNQMFGCVGCGRCRETCPGAIDLRRVITRINSVRAINA